MILSARYGAVAASLPGGADTTGAMEVITSVTVASNTSKVTISSIPQTYDWLKLVLCTRNSAASGTSYYAKLGHNLATTIPTFARVSLYSNTSATELIDTSAVGGYTLIPSYGNDNNGRGIGVLNFHDYAISGRKKCAIGLVTDPRSYQTYNIWEEPNYATNAFNQLEIAINFGTVGAGTQITLYGVTKA